MVWRHTGAAPTRRLGPRTTATTTTTAATTSGSGSRAVDDPLQHEEIRCVVGQGLESHRAQLRAPGCVAVCVAVPTGQGVAEGGVGGRAQHLRCGGRCVVYG